MFHDSTEVLRILLSIPEKQIRQDVLDGELNFERMLDETAASTMAAHDSKDARVVALNLHQQMVRAKILQSREYLPPEIRLLYAVLPAETIASEATSVAQTKGRLGELNEKMEEIAEREGLEDGEYWLIGEGPDDYEVLSSESDQIFQQVQDTVLTTILRRYELGEIADLLENDEAKFDELREAGRVQVFGNAKFDFSEFIEDEVADDEAEES